MAAPEVVKKPVLALKTLNPAHCLLGHALHGAVCQGTADFQPGGGAVDLLQRVNDVFRDVFDSEDLTITRQTSAVDVEGWDSLMHVRLIIAIEKEFDLRFSSAAIAAFKNVGDLLDALDRHRAGA
jgi:acyl carrier protein